MKILASDFDGTLFRNDVVEKRDIEAVRRFRAAGNKFGLVTGRAPVLIRNPLEQVPDLEYDFLILCSGGIFLDEEWNELCESIIPIETVNLLLQRLKEYGVSRYGISDAEESCLIKGDKEDRRWGFLNAESSPAGILERGRVIGFFVTEVTEEKSRALLKRLMDEFGGKVEFQYNRGAIDINALHAEKSFAMDTLERMYGCEAYRIGDADNDVAMLQKRGFCVSDGCEVAKRAAGTVVDSVADAIDILMNEK